MSLRCISYACLLALLSSAAAVSAQAATRSKAMNAMSDAPLLGATLPPWQVSSWINSPPLELAQLAGRVVLVRFWTAPDCPFCSASAPALNDFHARYASRGLHVIGFYHHKARSPLDPSAVAQYAKLFGFGFPIAIDAEWKTLRRWWLDGAKRDYTSVTFLIDRQGRVRHIHPGGQYVKGEPEHTALQAAIERLLGT